MEEEEEPKEGEEAKPEVLSHGFLNGLLSMGNIIFELTFVFLGCRVKRRRKRRL